MTNSHPSSFGKYRAPCADLRCPAHATGDFRDCECGGWKRWAQTRYEEEHRPVTQPTLGVALDEIDRQRSLGWPDFHPEDFCHRCGHPNTRSWFTARETWEEAKINGRWNEIICPSCFSELWERAIGRHATFELRLADVVAESNHHP